MCVIDEAHFDPKFVPSPDHISFLKGIMYGSHREAPGDGREFAVMSGWIANELPRPRANLEDLMDAGYVLCVSEQFDGAVHYALTGDAIAWCVENGIIPGHEERDASSDWVDALTFDRKRRRIPGLRRSFKPTVKTTSECVKQISYTPEEAAVAHEDIEAMMTQGHISERSASAFKAHITRRIQQIAV